MHFILYVAYLQNYDLLSPSNVLFHFNFELHYKYNFMENITDVGNVKTDGTTANGSGLVSLPSRLRLLDVWSRSEYTAEFRETS
jgi:hypothetical protein